MTTMNRLGTCHNRFQGDMKKVLCVCSAGLLRSPTAAVVLQREFGYNTRAAGLTKEYALIPVDDVLLEWADEVVVMETWMYHELEDNPRVDELTCLNVPDVYPYMAQELQDFILTAYKNKQVEREHDTATS